MDKDQAEGEQVNGKEAAHHAVALEQCSLFVDSAPLEKAMTDAAAFLRRIADTATGREPGARGDMGSGNRAGGTPPTSLVELIASLASWVPYPEDHGHTLNDLLVIGRVERFADDGPAYGNALGERTGAIDTAEAARRRVIERAAMMMDRAARERGEARHPTAPLL